MTSLALRLFGAYFRARKNKYSEQSKALRVADMHMSIEAWLSIGIFYSLVMALLLIPILILTWLFVLGNFPIWDVLTKPLTTPLLEILRISGELLLLALVVSVYFILLRFFFNSYLVVMTWERKRKIDRNLPYAIGWMASMATVGIIPYKIFEKLAGTEEYYGEVSKEAKWLVRDVTVLGIDFMSALRNLATITPSQRFRVFLQGAITSALSGGEMGPYFVAKAHEYMEENRRRFADYINTLGMLSEVYIITMIAGPLFIIVMFSAIMMLGGADPLILKVIIYAGIPVGSFMFIMFTDALSPTGGG